MGYLTAAALAWAVLWTLSDRWWPATVSRIAGTGRSFGNGWFQVRIDHILTGPAWRAKKAVVDPVTGVDHRPVVADLSWVDARR
jgi:endonuclease/exonuclease/phosphatase (EEP) superfamily protein YafD